MAIVVVSKQIKVEELVKAKEDYGEYIKVVVDIVGGKLTAGGEWHADGEKILLNTGSKQEDLWGGGIDLTTGDIDYVSLINTRPKLNNSQEVTDEQIRQKMKEIISEVFSKYVK